MVGVLGKCELMMISVGGWTHVDIVFALTVAYEI